MSASPAPPRPVAAAGTRTGHLRAGVSWLVPRLLLGLSLGACSHLPADPSRGTGAFLSLASPPTGAPPWTAPEQTVAAVHATDPASLPPPPRPRMDLLHHRGYYRVWSLSLPSAGDNGQPGNRVEARYFESLRSGTKKLVVILPIYGKSAYPSRKLAGYLTRERGAADTNVLLLVGGHNLYDAAALAAATSEEELHREVDRTVLRMESTVQDIRRLLSWAAGRPEIDPHRIGIAGFSFSSILANLVMATDSRVRAGVFFLGGAHVHEVFAHCHGNQVAHARHVLNRRFGWSDEEFAARLEPHLAPVEPTRWAHRLGHRPVLLGESPLDRVIPRRSRVGLWESLGRPERLVLRLNHRTAFLTMTPLGFNYTNRKIRRFFDQWLGVEGPPPALAPGAVAAAP